MAKTQVETTCAWCASGVEEDSGILAQTVTLTDEPYNYTAMKPEHRRVKYRGGFSIKKLYHTSCWEEMTDFAWIYMDLQG